MVKHVIKAIGTINFYTMHALSPLSVNKMIWVDYILIYGDISEDKFSNTTTPGFLVASRNWKRLYIHSCPCVRVSVCVSVGQHRMIFAYKS